MPTCASFSSSTLTSSSATISSSPPSGPIPPHPEALQSLAQHLTTSSKHSYPAHIIPHVQYVAWGDQDCFQHLNNVLYARYFESARLTWITQLCQVSSLSQQLHDGLARARGLGMILAQLNIKFRRPVVWPDTLLIAGEAVELEKDRFTIRAGMYSLKAWEDYLDKQNKGEAKRIPGPVATADQICVTYDYDKLARADMPMELAEALGTYGTRAEVAK